jgi:glycosyltransferase involved in cell wall biosynthesis
MNLLQITPGAGGMYCGGCFRDNALVAAWRKLGHDAAMIPLYLPMTLDEEDQSRGLPIFFGGINVYLQQKSTLFGHVPGWLHRALDSPRLLKWAAGSAAKTRPSDLGELTLSMLEGVHGHQKRELEELVGWLKAQFRPDIICLSNALLLGLVRRLKQELHAPVVCLLAGEDSFLDALPEPYRQLSWQTARERAREVDCFIAASQYYGSVMGQRLDLSPERIKVAYGGVNLDGYAPAEVQPEPPVLGYFARMCKEKGLPTLVDAFIELKRRDRVKGLRLRVGGGLSPTDEAKLVKGLRERLAAHGLMPQVDFCPNLTREEKIEFYRSISVLSVPALYGEAFGLYLVEAWASGVPVVQPRHAAFPELIELAQAGVLCTPGDPIALADGIEQLLLDPGLRRALGQAGRKTALERFGIEHMAAQCLNHFAEVVANPPTAAADSPPHGPGDFAPLAGDSGARPSAVHR